VAEATVRIVEVDDDNQPVPGGHDRTYPRSRFAERPQKMGSDLGLRHGRRYLVSEINSYGVTTADPRPFTAWVTSFEEDELVIGAVLDDHEIVPSWAHPVCETCYRFVYLATADNREHERWVHEEDALRG